MPHAAAMVGREDGARDQMISSRRTRVKTLTHPTPTKAAGNGQPPNRFRICDLTIAAGSVLPYGYGPYSDNISIDHMSHSAYPLTAHFRRQEDPETGDMMMQYGHGPDW
jgi:hypothetical protein